MRKKREIKQLKKDKKDKYKEFVLQVKTRDNYTCQICNKTFESPLAIQAMHILSKENYPELKYDVMNGLTGCFRDHKNSRLSTHLDGFAFVLWFQEKFPDRYEYLKNKLKEINDKRNNDNRI